MIFARSSLLIHAVLLASFLDFLITGIHCSWTRRRKSLCVNFAFLSPLPYRAYFHGILPSRSRIKRINPGVLKSRIVSLLWKPPCCPKDLFKVPAAQAALGLHVPTTASLVMRTRSSISPHLAGSSITWSRKFSAMHSRNLMDFLCPSALLLQEILRWLKSSMRTSECEAAPVCLQMASSTYSTWPGSL